MKSIKGLNDAIKNTGHGFILTTKSKTQGSRLFNAAEIEETIVVQPEISLAVRDIEEMKTKEKINKINTQALKEFNQLQQNDKDNIESLKSQICEKEREIRKNELENEMEKCKEIEFLDKNKKLQIEADRKKNDIENLMELLKKEQERIKIENEPKIENFKSKNEKLKQNIKKCNNTLDKLENEKNSLTNQKDENMKNEIVKNQKKLINDDANKLKYDLIEKEIKEINKSIEKLKQKNKTLKITIEQNEIETNKFDEKENELKDLLFDKDIEHQNEILKITKEYAEIEKKRSG